MSRTRLIFRRCVAVVAAAGLLGIGLARPRRPTRRRWTRRTPRPPPTVAADALPAPQIDGVVWSQTVVGDTVYVAGKLHDGAAGGLGGGGEHGSPLEPAGVQHQHRAAAAVGARHRRPGAWRSRAPRTGRGSTSRATSTTSTASTTCGIAAFNTATNTIVAGFKPTLAAAGLAVAASNTTVYAGGNFLTAASTTGGTLVPRSHLAAFDATTGALTPFVADANDAVMSLAVTADLQRVVVGGRFTSLSGSPFYGLGSVRPDDRCAGLVPGQRPDPRRRADVRHHEPVRRRDRRLRHRLPLRWGRQRRGPVPRSTRRPGALTWVADCHGDTYSSFPVGGVVYVASHEHYCGNMGGFPQTDPWTFYHATAFTKAVTGVNTAGHLRLPGPPRRAGADAADLLPDVLHRHVHRAGPGRVERDGQRATTSSTAASSPASTVAPQQGLVRFAVPSKAPNKQGPQLSSDRLDSHRRRSHVQRPGPRRVPVELRPRQRDADVPALPRLRRTRRRCRP